MVMRGCKSQHFPKSLKKKIVDEKKIHKHSNVKEENRDLQK